MRKTKTREVEGRNAKYNCFSATFAGGVGASSGFFWAQCELRLCNLAATCWFLVSCQCSRRVFVFKVFGQNLFPRLVPRKVSVVAYELVARAPCTGHEMFLFSVACCVRRQSGGIFEVLGRSCFFKDKAFELQQVLACLEQRRCLHVTCWLRSHLFRGVRWPYIVFSPQRRNRVAVMMRHLRFQSEHTDCASCKFPEVQTACGRTSP